MDCLVVSKSTLNSIALLEEYSWSISKDEPNGSDLVLILKVASFESILIELILIKLESRMILEAEVNDNSSYLTVPMILCSLNNNSISKFEFLT